MLVNEKEEEEDDDIIRVEKQINEF